MDGDYLVGDIYLELRGQTYCFERRVPVQLVAVLGKTHTVTRRMAISSRSVFFIPDTSNISLKAAFRKETGELFDERLRFHEDSEWARRGFELRYNELARDDHLHPVDLDAPLARVPSAAGRSALCTGRHNSTIGLYALRRTQSMTRGGNRLMQVLSAATTGGHGSLR